MSREELRRVTKAPAARLDYGWDWLVPGDEWLLAGDTIIASSWAITPTGSLTIDDDEHTDTVTIVWLTGGLEDLTYLATNTITTAAGRIDERTLTVQVASPR